MASSSTWGIDANILWLKLSGHDNDLPGEMLTSARLGFKLFIGEAVAYHRVAEWDAGRSFFEVGVGARAIWLDVNLGLSEDDPGIAAVSERLANDTLDRIDAGIMKAEGQLWEELKGLEGDLGGHGGRNIGNRVLRGKRVRRSIQRVAAARASEIAISKAAISNEKAMLAARAARDRERAEEKLAGEIDRALRKVIPDSAGGSKGWVDPIVMMRLRQQLGDKLFFQLYGDIGGFGVSSELTWMAEVGFGCQIMDSVTAGLYFRYWNVDYESGHFVFDVDVYGPVVSVEWTF